MAADEDGPTSCCRSTPGDVPCRRGVDTDGFWELGRGRRGERSFGGGFGRLGRWRRQDAVLPPGQGHHDAKQHEGGRSGKDQRVHVLPPAGNVRRGGQQIGARSEHIGSASGSHDDGRVRERLTRGDAASGTDAQGAPPGERVGGATLPGARAACRTLALAAVSRQASSSHSREAGRVDTARYPQPLGRTTLWGEAPVPGIDAVSRSRGRPTMFVPLLVLSAALFGLGFLDPLCGWRRRCWSSSPPATVAIAGEAGSAATVPISVTIGTTRTAGIVRTAGIAATAVSTGRVGGARTVETANAADDPSNGRSGGICGPRPCGGRACGTGRRVRMQREPHRALRSFPGRDPGRDARPPRRSSR